MNMEPDLSGEVKPAEQIEDVAQPEQALAATDPQMVMDDLNTAIQESTLTEDGVEFLKAPIEKVLGDPTALANLSKDIKMLLGHLDENGKISAGMTNRQDVEAITDATAGQLGINREMVKQIGSQSHSKTAFLIGETGCVARTQDLSSEATYVERITGQDPETIANIINNDLICARVKVLHGTPIDLVEQVIPLADAIKKCQAAGDLEAVQALKDAKAANPLARDYVIEAKDRNLGLVKRKFPSGGVGLLVVAFDLGAAEDYIAREGSDKLQALSGEAKPIVLDEGRFKASIPEIDNLSDENAIEKAEAIIKK